ncbi:glycerophosphodiester phosphodiesterase [Staphylococcus aureus]|uniref:Glycerophosphodiester phosphodiesterase n=1 Tax=Staphylococcus aureus TaxID=1280 RepID=A0A2X2K3M1_STAAU|nr:glycerophosphodiester phosphodiesterase [Staphylococcus aureus]
MKRISKDIWAVFKLLYQNKGRFSINALLLQLIMIFISSTYLILLFNMMLKVAGQSQLTINNWMEIVSHPCQCDTSYYIHIKCCLSDLCRVFIVSLYGLCRL